MVKTGLERNLHALQSLYPQQFEGAVQPLPSDALSGLPVWIKGAVRVFVLTRLGALQAPLIMMSQNRQSDIDRDEVQGLHVKLDKILREAEK